MMPKSVGEYRYLGEIGDGGVLEPRPLIMHAWTDGNYIITVSRPERLGPDRWTVKVDLVDNIGSATKPIFEDLGEHPDEQAAVGAAKRWMR